MARPPSTDDLLAAMVEYSPDPVLRRAASRAKGMKREDVIEMLRNLPGVDPGQRHRAVEMLEQW